MAAAELIIPEQVVQPDGSYFEIGSLLGSGAFAKCHTGALHDPQGNPVGKTYALKIVRSKMANRKVEQKFITELQIHSKIRHQNIVEFERAFSYMENTYLVLELCTKGSLQAMVKRRKSLTMPEVRRFLIQICGAVKYIHQNNVAHRDLKVGNIFLDYNLDAKIGDFGLAALLLDNEEKPMRRVTMCGTPNYLAPEIVTGKKRGHNEKVDLWAIGVIAFVLSVGQTPFNSASREEIYRKLQAREYNWPSASDSVNEIPTDLHDLVASLLVDEDQRPTPDHIVAHAFFKMAFIPRKLDPECLHKRPSWPQNRPPTAATLKAGYSSTWREMCSSSNVGEIDGQPISVAQLGNLAEFFKSEIRFNRAPVIPMPKDHMYLRFSEVEQGGLQDVTKPMKPVKLPKRRALAESTEQANKTKPQTAPENHEHIIKLPKVRQASTDLKQAVDGNQPQDDIGALPVMTKPTKPRLKQKEGNSQNYNQRDEQVKRTSSRKTSEKHSHLPKKPTLSTFRRNLSLALKNELPTDTHRQLTFIEQWVDYSKRHWIQYRLEDGSVGGIYLKTSPVTYMLLHDAQRHYNVVRGEEASLEHVPFEFFQDAGGEEFRRTEVDQEVRAAIGDHWIKMCSRWFKYDEEPSREAVRDTAPMFVTLYQRLGNVSVWGFVDGSFQFNFPDHTKLVLSPTGIHARLYALPAEAVAYLSSNTHLQTSHLLRRAHLSYPTISLLRSTDAAETPIDSKSFEAVAQANDIAGKIKFIIGVVKQWQLDGVSVRGGLAKSANETREARVAAEKENLETWKKIRWEGMQEAVKERDMRWTVVGRYAGSLR